MLCDVVVAVVDVVVGVEVDLVGPACWCVCLFGCLTDCLFAVVDVGPRC